MKVVVFPAPLMPSNPNTSPFWIPKERLSTATLYFLGPSTKYTFLSYLAKISKSSGFALIAFYRSIKTSSSVIGLVYRIEA